MTHELTSSAEEAPIAVRAASILLVASYDRSAAQSSQPRSSSIGR